MKSVPYGVIKDLSRTVQRLGQKSSAQFLIAVLQHGQPRRSELPRLALAVTCSQLAANLCRIGPTVTVTVLFGQKSDIHNPPVFFLRTPHRAPPARHTRLRLVLYHALVEALDSYTSTIVHTLSTVSWPLSTRVRPSTHSCCKGVPGGASDPSLGSYKVR